jgi:hypothetical protein
LPITTCISIEQLKLEQSVSNLGFQQGLIGQEARSAVKAGQQIAPANPIPLLHQESINPGTSPEA